MSPIMLVDRQKMLILAHYRFNVKIDKKRVEFKTRHVKSLKCEPTVSPKTKSLWCELKSKSTCTHHDHTCTLFGLYSSHCK